MFLHSLYLVFVISVSNFDFTDKMVEYPLHYRERGITARDAGKDNKVLGIVVACQSFSWLLFWQIYSAFLV